jgi:hypothetical protein
MFKKILMAYNGSRDGKTALLQCCEIASFTKAETHLLAVAGMPSSMFLTEGFLPEELLEEEKKRAQEVLEEGVATQSPAILPSVSRSRRFAGLLPKSAPASSWWGMGAGVLRAGGTDRSARRCSTTHPAAFSSRSPGTDVGGCVDSGGVAARAGRAPGVRGLKGGPASVRIRDRWRATETNLSWISAPQEKI